MESSNVPQRTAPDRHSQIGTLRNIRPGSRGSLRLDIGSPDHLAPFLGVVCEELAAGHRALPLMLLMMGALDAHGRVPKSATSDGDKAKGPVLPVAVFWEIPWQYT